MAQVCAAARCGVVLMHTRGRPEEWRALPPLEPKPGRTSRHGRRCNSACTRPWKRESSGSEIVLDPGFGFGIIADQNYSLLAGLDELGGLGQPLLAGVSRKGFLGKNPVAAL